MRDTVAGVKAEEKQQNNTLLITTVFVKNLWSFLNKQNLESPRRHQYSIVHRTRCIRRKSKYQMLIYTSISITSIIHRIQHRKFIYMFKEKEMIEETWCTPKLFLICFECKEMSL
jgi:hypothetical protein